ncbi:MAG: ribbon-helix-helix protein, CopG family, partial [Candidatus Paceibacteria bacterium]
ERHSITISPEVWEILENLKQTKNKSISELIENAVKKQIKDEGYNATYFKMMADTEYVSDEENEELTKALDKLDDEDLEIADEYEVEI